MTSENIESLNEKANRCFMSGDWARSEELFLSAIEEFKSLKEDQVPNLKEVILLLDFAKLLSQKERNDDCLNVLKKALSILDKDYPDQLNLRIQANIRMAETLSFYEDIDETMNFLDKARELVEIEPDRFQSNLVSILSTSAAFVLSNENPEKHLKAEVFLQEAEALIAANSIASGEDLCNFHSTRAISLQLKGCVEEAQKYYIKALDCIEDELDSPGFGEACFGYATLRATDSKFRESLDFLKQRISARELKIGKDHPILKRAISALALTYSACGQLDEAEIEAQRYNQVVEMMGNPGVELKIDCLRILIDILQQQSRFSEAQALITRANDLAESIGNKAVQVRLLMDLARLKLDLGDFQDAVDLYKKALNLTLEIKGEDHFETAICLGLLGNAYFATHDYEEAEKNIKKSIALSSKQEEFFGNLLGADNFRYLGLVCLQQNKLDEAEDAFLKALAMLESTDMEETLQLAETLKNMGELYEAKGELEEAKRHFENALALVRKILGDCNFEVADYITCLADIARKQKSFKEAEDLYNQALEIFESTLGPGHPRTCLVLQRFGEISIEQSNYDEAEKFFESALKKMEQTLGTNHPDVGYTSYCLGATYHWKEMPSRAEKYYRKALAIKEVQLGYKHTDLVTIIEPLIDVLVSQGKHNDANTFNKRMIDITGYKHGKD